MTPAELTFHLMEALALTGGESGWKGTHGTMPDTIDDVVTVFDTDPQLDGRSMRGTVWDHKGIMLHVRAKSKTTAWAKVAAVCTALDAVYWTPLAVQGGTRLYGFHRKSGPALMAGRTETNLRFRYSVNYTMQYGGF